MAERVETRTNDNRFSGRIALVTGGASGIGAATIRRLRAEGARVATLDLNAEPSEGVLAVGGDVSRSADVDAAFERVESELGPIDVLVCAAGVPGRSLSTVEVTDDEWRRVLAINADGVFYCNRAAARGMVERGTGGWSTSPRWPARRVTRWRPRTRRRRPL